MKKLLFVAALGVAGLASAKEVKNESTAAKKEVEKETVSEKKLSQNSKEQAKILLKEIAWVGVSTWCGKVFYLNANDYSSMAELNDAATYFTNQQCAGASTFTGQFT